MGHPFWKENIKDRVKLLQSNVLIKLIVSREQQPICVKYTMQVLGNDISENFAPKFPIGEGPCPSLHYSLPPGKVQLWCIFFALLVMNAWSLTAELKFRENTGFAISRLPSLCLEKRFCFGDIINPLLITKLALSIWMNVCLVHVYI